MVTVRFTRALPIPRPSLWALALAVALLASAGISPARTAAAASPCGPTATVPKYTHIVVIAFENHSYASVLGSSAPKSYFKSLAAQCGTATHFTATSFPRSLPNYLAVTSGTTGGISGDCSPGPSCRSAAPSIFEQLGPTGWRSWDESAPSACDKADASPYVARHEPTLYYGRLRAATCTANVLPMPSPLPGPSRKFTWIVPNMDHDMHDGTLSQASAWLQTQLAGPNGLLNSAAYKAGHTAIFIWFDSAADTDALSTPVPLIVVAPSVGHRVVTTPLTDAHLLHGWEGLLGLPCQAAACSVRGFDAAFRL
jgi:phosphatidylinositol-3-phosphatase